LKDNKKSLEFQIIDWCIPEVDKTDNYYINIYGTNNNNITFNVKVTEYEPYFYVKPPSEWNGLSDKEFNRKKEDLNTTLLEEKYECIFKDPMTKQSQKYLKKIIGNDYVSLFKQLDQYAISFSMYDVRTGIGKIINAPCEVIKVDLPDSSVPDYYIYFKFSARDTLTDGRYKGSFLIQSEQGDLVLPLIDVNCPL
jgi:hypothetical protein